MKTISRYIMTLALLLTAVTGAWADETVFEYADPMVGTLTQGTTGTSATTVTINSKSVNAIKFSNTYKYADGKYITIAPTSGSFKKGDVVSIAGCISNGNAEVYAKAGIYTADGATQLYETANVVNAQLSTDALVVETYTLTQDAEKLLIARSTGTTALYITTLKVARTASAPAPDGPEVTWDPATNTGTFTQPGYDVVLTPIYAPAAQWATEGNEVLAPTAIEGVIAGTTDAIVKAGTVATGQGTAMYFATTDATMTAEKAATANGWLSTLPTAAGYDDATTVYVWYYIAGADTPDGQEATDKNTFNDSEICTEPIEVSVLSNKFDIAFKAANANTIESGKATVTVKTGDAEAVDKTADIDAEHKLKAVKMGSTVTITTKEGYKFRKVEAKKGGSAVLAPALENGATVVIICDWGDATTTFTYTNNGGTFSGQASGYEAGYFHNGLELNGKNLSFGAWNVDNSEYLSVGITFNTESSAYSYTGKGEDFSSFTISVNGTDVTDQLSELK